MSGLKNSPFGKRLRASQQDFDDDGHRRNRPRTTIPYFGVASTSTPSLVDSSRPATSERGTDTPDARKEYGDRFVPSRDTGDMRTTYHLMDAVTPSTPSKSRIIPTESDALKEQANALYTSILHTEITPASIQPPPSPTRSSTTLVAPSTPTRRRLFAFNSPSHSNPGTPTRRLDAPTDEAYSMSPVRPESRALLESPRRKLRNVTKTPYRVLDAPELADDFYLNLVDWSSTNVLGVGLGACVYLWTAHTAQVSKLCDLSSSNDTVSSVSWVQKVSDFALWSQWLIDLALIGYNSCCRDCRRAIAPIRREHSHTASKLPTSTFQSYRCPLMEQFRPHIRVAGPDDSPSRRTRLYYATV